MSKPKPKDDPTDNTHTRTFIPGQDTDTTGPNAEPADPLTTALAEVTAAALNYRQAKRALFQTRLDVRDNRVGHSAQHEAATAQAEAEAKLEAACDLYERLYDEARNRSTDPV